MCLKQEKPEMDILKEKKKLVLTENINIFKKMF